MKESLSVRFLYETIVGRAVLKLLVKPQVSKAAGIFLNSKASVVMIPHFMKKNNISLEGIKIPEKGFASFNEFFYREKNNKDIDAVEDQLISPCDAFLSCIRIQNGTVFDVKHTKFTLEDLLQNKNLSNRFLNGYALVFRLTPSHYHRYCYSAYGEVKYQKKINGILHCVRPIATSRIPVFTQNSREYEVIKTENFGNIVQMEVGAMMVGKVTNLKKNNRFVRAGQEKGYFEFGGSTIILLLEKNEMFDNSKLFKEIQELSEIPVKQGNVLFQKNRC